MEETAKNQHFKNLLSIAFADGILDRSELEFLFKKSNKYYITLDEVENLVENSVHVKPVVISDKIERAEKMLDLIEMMLIDGETHERENRLCVSFGVSLGYSSESIHEMISKVITMIEEGQNNLQVLKTIESYH
jgi:uncharacterized tellurite resistance protein B-like protein